MAERLTELLVVICHCGTELTPIAESEEEVLYVCPNLDCVQQQPQINVMTREKHRVLAGDY